MFRLPDFSNLWGRLNEFRILPSKPKPEVKPEASSPSWDNKLTYRAVMELGYHEGLVRQAYKDSVGVWTWSVGITSASGHDVRRYINNPASLKHCLKVWVWVLEKYAEDVREAFTRPLTEEQFAAALSFHYNTGGIKRASWVDHFNAGDMRAAEKAFMNWRKPPEIIPRREAERDLFFRGKWSSDGTMTEYTRLSQRKTPVWSSARKVKVEGTLKELL